MKILFSNITITSNGLSPSLMKNINYRHLPWKDNVILCKWLSLLMFFFVNVEAEDIMLLSDNNITMVFHL